MNLVALLVATALMGIGAPIVVQYIVTPLQGTSELAAQASASAFAESLQWKLRRKSGNFQLINGDLILSQLNASDVAITEVVQAPTGCSFVQDYQGVSGLFISCRSVDRPSAAPSVLPLVSSRHCESDLFPGVCKKSG